MDQRDAKAALEEMIKDKQTSSGRDIYLISSTGKIIAQNTQKKFDSLQWKQNPELTILTKIFSRQLNFTRNEIQYLASLEPNLLKTYLDFFNNEIAYCWPPIASILTELQSRVEKMQKF